MSRQDALDVLGLEEGASEKDIRTAYRKLMKKHHPGPVVDQPGLAARINEARNVCWAGGKG